MNPRPERLFRSASTIIAGSPRQEETFELEPVPGYSGGMGLDYVRGFAEAILTGGAPAITGEDGVAALKVAETIYQSAEEKRWLPVRA